jgi:3-hydroxyisobutyrate dehydrogenase-like beta-hydroxyacid dehydrogenase
MKIGFIGLGTMGGNMALHLLDQGEDLVITDINRDAAAPILEAGAAWADSPAEVAAATDIVLSSLPGPPQVEAVALGPGGILEGIRPGSLYVDLSTSTPTLIQRIGERFAEQGVGVLDAPVSGGMHNSRDGSLTVLVGGSDDDFERAEPVLDHLAKILMHVGPPGAGAVAKLVNNAVGLSTLVLLSEVMSIGVKAGIDHQTLLKVLQNGAYGQGAFLHHILPNIAFKRAYEPATFALALGRKDIALATALGRELNVPMPMVNLTEQAAVELVARGNAHIDATSIFSLQEMRSGAKLHDDDAQEVSL